MGSLAPNKRKEKGKQDKNSSPEAQRQLRCSYLPRLQRSNCSAIAPSSLTLPAATSNPLVFDKNKSQAERVCPKMERSDESLVTSRRQHGLWSVIASQRSMELGGGS